jgi:molybdopterin converting factor small subunit
VEGTEKRLKEGIYLGRYILKVGLKGGGGLNVSLRCIGPLERYLSRKGTLEVSPGTTVGELVNRLALPGDRGDFADQYCVVVNGKFAAWDTVLSEGDEVFIFLPLAGG